MLDTLDKKELVIQIPPASYFFSLTRIKLLDGSIFIEKRDFRFAYPWVGPLWDTAGSRVPRAAVLPKCWAQQIRAKYNRAQLLIETI